MANEATFWAELTQFMRPDGTAKQVKTELPASVQAAYSAMERAGCRLEAECLMTGEVSITVSDMNEDLDCSVTPNGPQVQAGIVAMLERGAWNKKGAEADA